MSLNAKEKAHADDLFRQILELSKLYSIVKAGQLIGKSAEDVLTPDQQELARVSIPFLKPMMAELRDLLKREGRDAEAELEAALQKAREGIADAVATAPASNTRH